MQHIIENIRALSGAKRYGTAFLAGALLALSMAPVGFFPVALASVPVFLWLLQGAVSRRHSFLTGWAYGSGYLIAGLYWISAALFVDIAQWFWALPLSLVVGPSILALLYYGPLAVLAHRWRRTPAVHALAVIILWAGAEWLRGHLLTGFPWNAPGYMWQHILPVLQVNALAGIYGLTLLTLLWAATPAFWHHRALRFGSMTLFVVALAYGFLRILPAAPPASDITVRIVQASVPQDAKWDEAAQRRNLDLHLNLSGRDTPADVVIWPETAVGLDMVMYPQLAETIARHLPAGSIGLIGSLRMTPSAQAPDGIDYRNGLYVLDSSGQVLQSYDKFHLVPFGEYIPFRHYLNLTPIAAGISGIGDFKAGPGPRSLHVADIPTFSPLICYEVIFPGNVTDKTDRPAWLVNVTNDAWYGRSAGPYQHLQISRVRAIEEGLPLARAANNGISAMIDPLGRVTAQLPLYARGALTTQLPQALPPTLYSRIGDMLFAVMMIALLIATAIIARSGHQHK